MGRTIVDFIRNFAEYRQHFDTFQYFQKVLDEETITIIRCPNFVYFHEGNLCHIIDNRSALILSTGILPWQSPLMREAPPACPPVSSVSARTTPVFRSLLSVPESLCKAAPPPPKIFPSRLLAHLPENFAKNAEKREGNIQQRTHRSAE